MLLRPSCRYTSNRPVQWKATFGRRVTGDGMPAIMIGCREYGSRRQAWACFGPRPGGGGTTARMCLTRVTGVRLSVFMEALITVMGIREMVTGAADGKETRSLIPPL